MAKLGQYGHQLETMTAQEVFDVATEHLLTQMEKSQDYKACLYDGGNICCAAAPFIKIYEKDLDSGNEDWDGVVSRGCASSNHSGLIFRLQNLHDNNPPEKWASLLRNWIAVRDELEYNGEQYE